MTEAAAPAQGLWAASASVQPVEMPTLYGEASVEIAILGAGFTGLSAALHAVELGCSVAVLEAETIGFGASGRNGGQVNPGVKLDEAALVERFGECGRALHRLGQEAPEFLTELVRRKGLRCQFSRPGLFRLAHNERALTTLRRAASALRACGVAAEDLDAGEMRERVGTARYRGGLYDPRGASVHPLDLVREMARAAVEAGARLFTRSPAISLHHRSGLWRIAAPRGALLARKVLVATNAYSDALVPGLARSLLPVNSFQIATAPLVDRAPPILPGNETVYDSRRLVLYFRNSPDRRVMLGGRASFSSSRTTPEAGADYSVLETVLTGIFPQLRGVPIEYRWTGLVGITFDHLPHYHALSDGLHALVGFNGRGVALAHRAGAWIGRKLAGAPEAIDIPTVPVRPFPFHAFRATALNVGMRWNRIMDLIGR